MALAVAVVAVAVAVVAAAAAAFAAADLLAAHLFRGRGRHLLGASHQKVAQCRVHGDRPGRGRDRDLRRFQGSRQGHIF